MDDVFSDDQTHALIAQRITSNPEITFGKPTVRGTRLTVERVLEFLANDDWSRLSEAFPGITDDDVRSCAAFAAEQVRVGWLSGRSIKTSAA